MSMTEIAGGRGAAISLAAGQAIELCNTHGSQVVDTWALNAHDMSEHFSVEHTRRVRERLFLEEGDTLLSNRRNPMMVLEKDTAGGVHDMLAAACDPWLYRHYGHPGHRSCHQNFIEALLAAGLVPPALPNPLNLWMNVVIRDSRSMTLERPVSKPGDTVVLRALCDVIVVLSACPMDITPVNGGDGRPMPVHYRVLAAVA